MLSVVNNDEARAKGAASPGHASFCRDPVMNGIESDRDRRRRFISKHAPECGTGPLKATRSRRHRNGSGIALRALTGPPVRA